MKFVFILHFGFAKPGDHLVLAGAIADARHYHGWLRTRRQYVEFIAPASCISLLANDSVEDEEYHARRTDPATSHDEMHRLGGAHSERARRILTVLAERGRRGATSKEAAELTGIPHVSTSTTMSKMLRANQIGESGERRNGSIVRVTREFHMAGLAENA